MADRTYYLDIDRKITLWVNETMRVKFDGTENELRTYLEDNEGDFSGLAGEYCGSEFLLETEEAMTVEQNEGNPVHEINELREEVSPSWALV